MIDFYTWNTPNGHKVAIMLEETGLPYRIHAVNIGNKEQFAPEFLAINPNNKIPAIVDNDGINHQPTTLFESGAILIYLSDKTKKFLPSDPLQRFKALQWLMFQMGGVGPMLGQYNHFLRLDEKIPYAVERYKNETKRLYRVMNDHLKKEKYFASDYSIADMAIFPWVNLYERQEINIKDYPDVARWHHTIAERPAVQKALQISKELVEKVE